MYGDPMEILSAKQTHEARKAERQRKDGTLRCKQGWSAARQRAEALFNFAPESVHSFDQGNPRNAGRAGDAGKDS